jgi:hypothetical protein
VQEGTGRALCARVTGLDLPSDLFGLSFPDFVHRAVGELLQFEWSIESDALFHFVRALKSHSHTKGMDAASAFAALEDLGEPMHDVLCDLGLDLSYEDSEVAFHSMWERARFPMGTDPVEAACALAGKGLIQTGKKRPGRYPRFLTAAALLQIQRRQNSIYLPVRKVAQYMPCEANSVTAWIGWAIQDGVLIRTSAHVFRSQGESLAAEYVFALHRLKQSVLDEIAELVALPVKNADLRWIQEQFENHVPE